MMIIVHIVWESQPDASDKSHAMQPSTMRCNVGDAMVSEVRPHSLALTFRLGITLSSAAATASPPGPPPTTATSTSHLTGPVTGPGLIEPTGDDEMTACVIDALLTGRSWPSRPRGLLSGLQLVAPILIMG